MKFLSGELLVHVTNEALQQDYELIPCFEGIYSVSINGFLAATFIPEFERNTPQWYEDKPESSEDIYTLEDARILNAITSPRSVTPSDSQAGDKELVHIPESKPPEIILIPEPDEPPVKEGFFATTLYYVSLDDFIRFRGELATVADSTVRYHQYVKLEDIKDYSFIKFILSNILTSKKLERIRSAV